VTAALPFPDQRGGGDNLAERIVFSQGARTGHKSCVGTCGQIGSKSYRSPTG